MLTDHPWEVGDLFEFHAVECGDSGGVGLLIDVAVIDLADAVGAERLHAGGAGHGGGGDDSGLAAAEQAA